MAIITRFGGSGGGTPVVDPYPHVWECTVVQSGTTGVVSGVVTLEAYDILHYTMPLGFSTYDLMIGGVTYHTSFRNEGEMYVQWTGTDFVVVSANAACALSHVWTSPTYTITGTVLEITAGLDELHTNDVIVLTLASGESASNIEYNSQVYTIDFAISEGTNYVQFNGTSFDNALFNFKGDATASDVASGKTFYSSDGTLRTGNASNASYMANVDKYYEFYRTFAPSSTTWSQYIEVPNDIDLTKTIVIPNLHILNGQGNDSCWITGFSVDTTYIPGSTYIRTDMYVSTSTTYRLDLTFIQFKNLSSIVTRIGNNPSNRMGVDETNSASYKCISFGTHGTSTQDCTIIPVLYDEINKILTVSSSGTYCSVYRGGSIRPKVTDKVSSCYYSFPIGNGSKVYDYIEYDVEFL